MHAVIAGYCVPEKPLFHLVKPIMFLGKHYKQVLQYRPKGRRNIGRPKKRWREQLHFEDFLGVKSAGT